MTDLESLWHRLLGPARPGPLDWLDELDPRLHSLLPMLAIREQHEHPRLTGLRRYYFTRTQLVKQDLEELAQLFGSTRWLLTGDAALVTQAYGEEAWRPCLYLSVLVPAEQRFHCARLLAGQGWSGGPVSSRADQGSSCLFQREQTPLVLRWHALTECRWPEADRGLVERAESFQWLGHTLWRPAASDALLLSLVRREEPWWGVDAVQLTRRHTIDWDLLAREARRRRVAGRVQAGLQTLSCWSDWPGVDLRPGLLESLGERAVAWRLGFVREYLRGCPASLVPILSGLPGYLWRRVVSRW